MENNYDEQTRLMNIPSIPELEELMERWSVPWGISAQFVVIAVIDHESVGKYVGPIGFFETELAAIRIAKKMESLGKDSPSVIGFVPEVMRTTKHTLEVRTNRREFSVDSYLRELKKKGMLKKADGYSPQE